MDELREGHLPAGRPARGTSAGKTSNWRRTATAPAPLDVTRRTFIQGSVATGAAVSMAGGNLLQPDVRAPPPKPVARTIDLQVKRRDPRTRSRADGYAGHGAALQAGPHRQPSWAATGAECGACTVLIDDVPHYGCSILVHQVRGREVTTVEGLEQDGVLHPVQQAVLDEMGFQCAFCAPGFNHEHGRPGQGQPERDPRGRPEVACRPHLPLRRLQQDPEHRRTRARERTRHPELRNKDGQYTRRHRLRSTRSDREGHRTRQVRGGLARRGHAVRQAVAVADAPRPGAEHRRPPRRWRWRASRRFSPRTTSPSTWAKRVRWMSVP